MTNEVHQNIQAAQEILIELNLPKTQTNERAALTLLALAEIGKNESFTNANARLHRTIDLMDFMRIEYGKDYKANSRETIRRQTLHQFMQHYLVTKNRDDLQRPTNSGLTNYSLNNEILQILKIYPNEEWKEKAQDLVSNTTRLLHKHKKRIARSQVIVNLPNAETIIRLSAGAHNQLHADIVHKFLPQFASENTQILYIGDTASIDGTGGKHLYTDKPLFEQLNIENLIDEKLPDIVAFDPDTQWLYLIEAVTSHGPISEKRWQELKSILSTCNVDPVFVTAFPNKTIFKKYAAEIAWETEVWLSENPEHMIHFNGDRFMGPH